MTVPLSEAVARRVPVELMDRKEIGALCAWMTLETVRERVENRRTSPDWVGEVEVDDEDEAVGCREDGCVVRGAVGEGTGEG